MLALAACSPDADVDVVPPGMSRDVVGESKPEPDTDAVDTASVDTDTGETGEQPHTGDTHDSGGVESGDTHDSGTVESGGGDDSGDTGEGVPPEDSGETGGFDTSLVVDTADTGAVDSGAAEESGGTDTGAEESGGATGGHDTSMPVDTSLSGDTGLGGGADTSVGFDTSHRLDTAGPADTSGMTTDTGASATTSTDSGSDTGFGVALGEKPADTADTADTADSADTSNPLASGDTADTAATAATDTSVYFPGGCDTADTGGCSSVIRFVALGVAGTGDSRQTAVASAIEAICVLDGCDFALYLGDNIYYGGPTSVTDVQWNTKFEVPYAGLGFQFYAVLGNHDYGGHYDTATAAIEVAYTAYSSKWYMPSRYYTEPIGDVTVLALDTQSMQLGHGADQDAWISGAVAAISTTWTVAIGHHPYISNGPHGNAGEFDGMAGEGQPMKDFFDAYVCGAADVYLAGHDHALQWMDVPSGCATEFIIAGGGGSGTYPIVGTNPALFEDSNNGFLWVEIDGRQFTGVFYDETGAELYRRVFTK